jgi:hypothetical protein
MSDTNFVVTIDKEISFNLKRSLAGDAVDCSPGERSSSGADDKGTASYGGPLMNFFAPCFFNFFGPDAADACSDDNPESSVTANAGSDDNPESSVAAESQGPWVKYFSRNKDPYEGVVASHTDLSKLIEDFSVQNLSQFAKVSGKSLEKSGKSNIFLDDFNAFLCISSEIGPKSKIQWKSIPSKGPQIPFSGQPFCIVTKAILECHHGGQRHCKSRKDPVSHCICLTVHCNN